MEKSLAPLRIMAFGDPLKLAPQAQARKKFGNRADAVLFRQSSQALSVAGRLRRARSCRQERVPSVTSCISTSGGGGKSEMSGDF